MTELGPLVSAVQDLLSRPGVTHHAVRGQWRIEASEADLLAWLAEQRAAARSAALAGPAEPRTDAAPVRGQGVRAVIPTESI